MRYFLTLIITLLPLISSAQSAKLLEIDASSFAPVQTDVLSGVAIDKIGTDPSRRPCARIKMHVNRMSKEEINDLSVRTVGGSVVVTKCVVASEGNGLIIELTAKESTRFYLHHEKYGDSNEVSLNLEGNKEYRIEASLNTTYSIVVLSNVSEAEVYLDGEYKGVTDRGNSLTVKDVYPGKHSIKVVRGSFTETLPVDVNSDNVFFRLDLETGQLKRHFVTFKIEPKGTSLKIDGVSYAENISQDVSPMLLDGEYSYSVSADMYHTEEGTIVLDGSNIEKVIRLKPAYGWLQVNDKGELKGASVFVDGNLVGKAPIKTDRLASGNHVVRIEQNMYKSFEQNVTVRDSVTFDLSPILEPKFANVVLRSGSNDGDIYINDEYKGPSPWSGRIIFGSYQFLVRKANHRPNSIVREITAQSEGVQIMVPAPSPILGKLEIESQPSGTSIYIDGQKVGISPNSYDLLIGKHTVVLEKDGFKTYKQDVEVKENETTVVKVALEEGLDIDGSPILKDGRANCYIVSEKGTYYFPTVKGNSSQSIESIEYAEVLWESFGTSQTPLAGDLISKVSYSNGIITFQTNNTFKEGNAVIAAKDASGNILWSWHIWFTDQPQGQEYYNNAGIVMDRNLGATSATPGDVGALGLLYQWGRKDPFLGSSAISSDIVAKSTLDWPSAVQSDSSTGTIDYAIANPTTFIHNTNFDWCYKCSESINNNRWTTSESAKSIYDPCPAGWRIPDGGSEGVWSKALGSSSYLMQNSLYDSTNEGMNFSERFGEAFTIWYPLSGYRNGEEGALRYTGGSGDYWTVSTNGVSAYNLCFRFDGSVYPEYSSYRVLGLSVRCVREGSFSSNQVPHIETLSKRGPANCYIISESGTYRFPTVIGNSSESVGPVDNAVVLWESFGNSITPETGNLIKSVTYEDGYIILLTADYYTKGNALVAAKDSNGKILWSWHIWFTEQPQKQEYFNYAGAMMDRNLGAISADPSDIGSLGLLYQWGRKDPFLGASSFDSTSSAKSTLNWPAAVPSDSSTGTVEFTIENPTTFLTRNEDNCDWYYTGSSSTDNTRWTTLDKKKSVYDPCPAGWRVSSGGDDGIWSCAKESVVSFKHTDESMLKGANFSKKFGFSAIIWYPASGYRNDYQGSLFNVGQEGCYWSCTPRESNSISAYSLYFDLNEVLPSNYDFRANGFSVRCVKE